MQRQALQTRKRYPKRAFSWVRAGGSLNPGVSYGEARAGAKALALVSLLFTGETSKEPLFFFLLISPNLKVSLGGSLCK